MNVPKSSLAEFFDDLEAKLSMLTGIVDIKEIGLRLKDVRKPMMVIGLPGMGKTCGIISLIAKLNEKLPEEKQLGFKKILLGQTVVGSMQGIPVARPDGTVVRIQVPDLPDPERDGEYGVLFMDEITTADEAQVQPCLGLADDSRNIGTYTLPEHWMLVGAGNGPDCSNFVRLDDMTISRFSVYDIAFDFKSDLRPYALSHNFNDNIVAFLNFAPDCALRVESSDMDENGKLFPSPRTWERLSTELAIRQAVGKPVPVTEMSRFSGRFIGANAGGEFEAYCRCVEHLSVSPESIVEGKADDPDRNMKKELFYMYLQKVTKLLQKKIDESENYIEDESCYIAVANALKWFLKMQTTDLESTINAVMQLNHDDERCKKITQNTEFDPYCPEYIDFIEQYGVMMINNKEVLQLDL